MFEVAYGAQPSTEQITFFRAKLSASIQSWTGLFSGQHGGAFAVAGTVRDELLIDFGAARLRRGDNWRSRVIYENNLTQSYRAGRWEQIQRIKRRRPYVRFGHAAKERHPRLGHRASGGIVAHIDAPWLLTHFPYSAWSCQCWRKSLAQRSIDRVRCKVTPRDGADDHVRFRWAVLQFVDRVVTTWRHRGDAILVGGHSNEVVSRVKTAGIRPAASSFAMSRFCTPCATQKPWQRARQIGRKRRRSMISKNCRHSRAVLLDARSSTLVYFVDSDQREAAKLAVAVNFKTKRCGNDGKQRTLQISDSRTASLIDAAHIAPQISDGVLHPLSGQ